MYKPNFCSNCGERIERARWHLWTSRRFCHECATQLRAARLTLPVFASLALIGLGVIAGSSVRHAAPPLIVEQHRPIALPAQTTQVQSPPPNAKTSNAPAPAKAESIVDKAATGQSDDSTETVSICGAMTKKGTPCQRRVRGTGRCYQHKGQPAIIPVEQRVITGR